MIDEHRKPPARLMEQSKEELNPGSSRYRTLRKVVALGETKTRRSLFASQLPTRLQVARDS